MVVTLDDIYNLGSYVFVAGGTQTFIFTVTQDGAVIDITGSTCSAKICPLGQTNILTIELSGTITDAAGGIFECVLDGSDSEDWSGVYQIQPVVIDIDDVPHMDGVGLLTVSPRITD